jgi:hypothetical protein
MVVGLGPYLVRPGDDYCPSPSAASVAPLTRVLKLLTSSTPLGATTVEVNTPETLPRSRYKYSILALQQPSQLRCRRRPLSTRDCNFAPLLHLRAWSWNQSARKPIGLLECYRQDDRQRLAVCRFRVERGRICRRPLAPARANGDLQGASNDRKAASSLE